MHRLWSIFLILLFLGTSAFAQETKDITAILDEIEEEEDLEIIAEQLEYLINHPINLNEATSEELTRIPFFDDFFVRNLLLYRSRVGKINSIYELKNVQGAPINKLRIIEPLLIVDHTYSDNDGVHQDLYVGSEILLPQYDTPYKNIGIGLKYEGKIDARHRWGLVLGKDRGEPWLPIRKGGVDHISFSYQNQNNNGLQITLGDYKVTTGVGILMGQSLSYFSNAETSSTTSSISNKIIRPHISFREYNYLRGAAIGTDINNLFNVHVFYGIENIDARIRKGRVITTYSGGMHRSKSERKYRNTAFIRTLGTNISFQTELLQIGLTSLLQRYFDHSRYTLHPPHDAELHNTSLYFQYLSSHFKVYGESLLKPSDRIASIVGASYYNEQIGTLSIIGRYLAPNYYTIYGYPDSHYSSHQNEKGIKLIWKGELGYWWSGSLYLDVFQKIKSIGGKENSPGYVLTAKTHYSFNNTQLLSRLRWINLPHQLPRTTFKINIHQPLTSKLRLKGGTNLIYSNKNKVDWGIFTRLLYENSHHLKAELGVQYFTLTDGIIRSDNPSMTCRYYAPMLRGRGVRTTAALRYPINRNIKIQARTSFTFYSKLPTNPIPSLLDICASIKL